MSQMESVETKERFSDGLKQAISRAREMAKKQKNPMWNSIATSLEGIRDGGTKLSNAKGLSRAQVLRDVDTYQKRMTGEAPINE